MDDSGIGVYPEKTTRTKKAPRQTSKIEMRTIFGLPSYYGLLIQNFAKIAASLLSLNSKTGKFIRGPEMKNAFIELKPKTENVCTSRTPISGLRKPFVDENDASEHSVAAVLPQRDEDGKLNPAKFEGSKMNDAERRYTACQKEALAVAFALKNTSLLPLTRDI